ncbi:MAG: TonB-dependent receptor [Sphingobacteriaceae bacterium]|nr:TonB-dependent receptor [Sphingobacteriaceae bacterium]
MRNFVFVFILMLTATQLFPQNIAGTVTDQGIPVPFASVKIAELNQLASTDSVGKYSFQNIVPGKYIFRISAIGYNPLFKTIEITAGDSLKMVDFAIKQEASRLKEVVVTGTLKEVSRLESAVPVEVYNHSFFRKNPTPSIFDALQNVNGVRPQLNCNVCNTGDIHINGLEGPYTMVMIDGMPIVSSLSTVYGLSGIPNSLIERVEIVKGPASSLYGSEAVGGLINIITKSPGNAPSFTADVFSTNWGEVNTDLGFKTRAGKAIVLTGLNYYNYQNPIDQNGDNFTDVTLQHRASLFQKWMFSRKDNRLFSLAGRYFYEDRWGGDMGWTKAYRGGDDKYGESIYTNRLELLGAYQLPVKEKMLLSFSYNNHKQNSVYGTTSFMASQHIAFAQLTWDKKIHRHDLLAGIANRYTFYDDNTVGTARRADQIWLPGIFLQDEIELHKKHNILLGLRYDYNSNHGNIITPRFAYKWKPDGNTVLRLNAGTGFRVVNLFTEDHAALTGARDVVIEGTLKPEKSYNVNLNFLRKIFTEKNNSLVFEGTGWITHFNNRIIADYLTNSNEIRYRNLDGFAISKGLSANLDLTYSNGLKLLIGATLMDVYSKENGIKSKQLFTEPWMGTWSVSYPFKKLKLAVDYTGNIYGPMDLPYLSNLDPRERTSPVWSIQNIQFTYSGFKGLELYGGIKNLLNWTPNKRNPFLIARSNDPFDKHLDYNDDGSIKPTASNPYALSFDPTYMYAPNQGRRGFLGIRYNIKK